MSIQPRRLILDLESSNLDIKLVKAFIISSTKFWFWVKEDKFTMALHQKLERTLNNSDTKHYLVKTPPTILQVAPIPTNVGLPQVVPLQTHLPHLKHWKSHLIRPLPGTILKARCRSTKVTWSTKKRTRKLFALPSWPTKRKAFRKRVPTPPDLSARSRR